MSAAFVSRSRSALNERIAATPSGIVLDGTTMAFFSELSAACIAAGTMFRLFGSKTTSSAGALSTASQRSWTLGFIVLPRATVMEAPRLLNKASSPLPHATATTATESAGASASRRLEAENSLCCLSMFLTLTWLRVPWDTPRLRSGPGSSV